MYNHDLMRVWHKFPRNFQGISCPATQRHAFLYVKANFDPLTLTFDLYISNT